MDQLSTSLTTAFEKALQAAADEFFSKNELSGFESKVGACAQNAATSFAKTFGSSGNNAASADAAASSSVVPHTNPIRAYIDGCFDIMHSGHFNAIRQAKTVCDILVVGIHSCAEIERHKGPPVMNDEERVGLVKACKWADEVVFDTPYSPSLELLDKLNCDYAVHGDDMSTTADGKDAFHEVREAGRLKIVKRTAGVSTTDLVGRLLLMTKDHLSSAPQEIVVASESEKSAKVEEVKPTKHYTAGVSNFLPTTRRIAQFSNNRAPAPDDKIVYIDGSWDLFHIGHVEALQKAKELGTFLYVGIHDDQTVNKHKGHNYPVMDVHERVLNVLSCKYVDEVVIGAPWVVTADLINTFNIQVVCCGFNSKFDEPAGSETDVNGDPYAVPKSMGVFQQVLTTRTLQTGDVVERIIDNRLKYEARQKERAPKELKYIKSRTYVSEF